MPLNSNANMQFIDYEVTDTGISMHFLCNNPGAGMNSDYHVLVTDAELATITTQAQLKTLVTGKLQRKLRAVGIATKLDNLIGQSITI